MADFVKFGSAAINMARKCAGNCDRGSVAEFLALQQQAIRNKRIEDRLSGAGNAGTGQSGGAARPVASDPAVTGEASGAMARMMAMLGKK